MNVSLAQFSTLPQFLYDSSLQKANLWLQPMPHSRCLLHWVKDPNLFLAQETHNTSLVELRVRFSSQIVAASIFLLGFNHYTIAVDSVLTSVEIYGKKAVSILVSVAEQNDS